MVGTISTDCYIGKSTDKKHLAEANQKYLDNDETIIGFFHGARRPDFGVNFSNTNKEQRNRGFTLHDYMIITNKRLILWMRGLMSSNIETIDYAEINNVENHQGLLLGDIILNVHGAHEKFRDMVKTDVPIAADLIRNKIAEFKVAKKHIPTESKNEDPITILKRRYALGEITKNEYLEMLKTLGK